MADEIYTFRTIRVVDESSGLETNIIADQSEDVLTFVSAGDITFQVVEDRIVMSTENVRGYTGSIGSTGIVGYTGSVGIQGENGHTGSQGLLGSKGYSGSVGYTGSLGPQGNTGYTGSRGFTGSQGADSITPGYTGSQGLQGIIGFSGSVGSQGNVGYTGSQGIQGNIGFTGSKGFIGFTGSGGSTGSQGPTGFTGSIGYTGSRGSGGFTGSRGYTGSRGSQGIQGIQGVRGYTGSRGLQGIRGNTGYTGSRGFAGSTGFSGSRGVPGPQGSVGVGVAGSRGDTGYTGSVGPEAEAFKIFRTRDTNGVTRNIVADQTQDVLTWVSGAGIYLDFNEGTDTITVINTGGTSGNANVATDGNFAAGNLTLPLTSPASSDIGRVTWDASANVLYIGNGNESVLISGQSAIGFTGSQGTTGTQGNVGYTGSVGISGSMGYTGSAGSAGSTGPQGNIGFTGSAGSASAQGDTGYTGSAGSNGPQGNVGYTGSTGAGYTGSAGATGPQGNIGYTGSTGAGYTGSAGDAGPQGVMGYTGSVGSIGFTGSAGSAGSGLSNVSEDTSPQLGGSLDVNGKDIVSTSNGDIDLDPNGTGVVVFKGNNSKGSGQFKLNCEFNSHGIIIQGPPHSAAANYTLTLPNDDGIADQVLKTDGAGNLEWVDQTSGGGGYTRTTKTTVTSGMTADQNQDITIDGFKSFALMKIATTHAAWVRLYVDAASRTADASRTETTDPTPDAGVLAEVITTGAETVKLGPAVLGWLEFGTQIFAAVKNKSGATNNVGVTLTLMQLEA
jgi:hypothetical protein